MSKRVFAFNYVLTGPNGDIIDASEKGQPLPFLEGAGQIIPKLENAIKDMLEGDKMTVKINADEAYGMPDKSMVIQVPKAEFAHIDGLAVGSFLQVQNENQTQVFRVVEIGEHAVTVDGNHPLAGVDLSFDVEMVLVREATAEELAHGHPHGLHGHSHH